MRYAVQAHREEVPRPLYGKGCPLGQFGLHHALLAFPACWGTPSALMALMFYTKPFRHNRSAKLGTCTDPFSV